MLEVISQDGTAVCILVRKGQDDDDAKFYTPKEFPLQVGRIAYRAGAEIPRHRHPAAVRKLAGTPEVLLVEKGRLSLEIYDNDRVLLAHRELRRGDLAILTSGGHGFRFIEDTVLLEVKQGPYLGDQDKEPF